MVTDQAEAHRVILFTVIFIIAGTVLFFLPLLYNFWVLFSKAKQPGWAILIPIYNSITYARIAKKSVWLGVAAGVLSISANGVSSGVAESMRALNVIGLIINLYILSGFVKQYRTKRYQWILIILLPFIGAFGVRDVVYIGDNPQENGASGAHKPDTNWTLPA